MNQFKVEKHNTDIDILRGISILTVILLHLNIRVPFSSTYIGGNLPASIYKIIFFSGFYGVSMFFVISGFLITTSTLNKWNNLPDTSLKGFYLNRFARIMPLFISLLIILSFLHISGVKGFVINPERTTLGRALLAALTFHINLLEIKVGYLPGSWDILWSLSIEEVFYLFFPVLCIISRKDWHFVALVSAFLILSPFARTVWYPGNEMADRNHFAYLDALSIGCIAAIATKKFVIGKKSLNLIAVAGWIMFILVMVFRKWISMIGLTKAGLNITVLSVGVALILVWMQNRFVNGEVKPRKLTALFRFLGKTSYEIYLTHMFVVITLVWAFNSLKLSGEWVWLLYVAGIVFSGLMGSLISRYFSTPLNYWLRSIFNLSARKQLVSESNRES